MRVSSRAVLIALPMVVLGLCFVSAAGSEDLQQDLAGIDHANPPMESVATPPDCTQSWRAVRLRCKPGAEGVAVGEYGGSGFFLSCGGETSTRVCTSGNEYGYLMEGREPDGPFVRCGLNGAADHVNEHCGPLHLIIN